MRTIGLRGLRPGAGAMVAAALSAGAAALGLAAAAGAAGLSVDASVLTHQGTAAPVSITVVSGGGGGGSPPSLVLTDPIAGQTVSGTMPVAATVTAGSAPIASVPSAVSWDTTTATNASHVLSAVATDTAGNTGSAPGIAVTVQNPAPPMTCFVMQARVSAHGSGTVTTPAFHTAAPGEVLLAFVATDGPNSAGSEHVTVTGAGLTWTLVKRANAQAGASEVAGDRGRCPGQRVGDVHRVAQRLRPGPDRDRPGGHQRGRGLGGERRAESDPDHDRATSLVFAVGNDWDRAAGRTLAPDWTMLDQSINTGAGDDCWSQYTHTPTGAAGTTVTVNDTASTHDRWNLVAVGLLNESG